MFYFVRVESNFVSDNFSATVHTLGTLSSMVNVVGAITLAINLYFVLIAYLFYTCFDAVTNIFFSVR